MESKFWGTDVSLIVSKAEINLITYLSLEEFRKIQAEILQIQKKKSSLARIEEPFDTLESGRKEVFSPSEIKGVGRLTIDGSLISQKSVYKVDILRLVFSKSCPVELAVSFEVRLNDNINEAVAKIKEYCKDVSRNLASSIRIPVYKSCFCRLYLTGTHQKQAIKEQLDQMNVEPKDLSIIAEAVVFRRQYSDLQYDMYFTVNAGAHTDEIEVIMHALEEIPIIEKIGQIVKDGLEGINSRVVPLENNLATMKSLVQRSDLDKLMNLRIEYLNLRSESLKYEGMHYSLREYLNVFLTPLESIMEKEKSGLIFGEIKRLREFYFREIGRLQSEINKKLDEIQNAVDSSIEIVNINETMKLSKASFRIEKWMAVLTIMLFVFAVVQLLQAFKLI